MARFVPKKLKVGQRVKLSVRALMDDGYSYGDVVQVHGDGFATVKLIHSKNVARYDVRLGPTDFEFVPGRPRFPHIDGPAEKYGANAAKSDGGEDARDGGESEKGGGNNPLLEALEEFIVETVEEKVGDAKVDESKMRAIAAEEAAKAGGKVVVKINDLPPVEIEGVAHAALPRVLRLAKAKVSKGNIALIGPAGCGKTMLAKQVAEALGLRFASLSCSPGMSEAKLLGRVIPRIAGDAASIYESTLLVDAYREGGVLLLDEMDNADPSILTLLNTMLDNGFVNLPDGSIAERHPDTLVIASMNTYGHGSDRIYVGRTALDGATLDRFSGTQVELDYDRALEAKLCPEDEIRKKVHDIRDKVREHKLRRIVSTRFLLAVRDLHLKVGDTLKEAIRACTTGWSEGDLKVAGIVSAK